MQKYVRASGPHKARVMLVGEAPGAEEEKAGLPFVGASGKELTRMLHEAGFIRSECFITNVCRMRPPENDISKFFVTKTEATRLGLPEVMGKYPMPIIGEGIEELKHEIEQCEPDLIIALGNTALWALTGEWGITNWRGSYLYVETPHWLYWDRRIPVLPTYHPAAILRQWNWRAAAVHDLKRARAILDEGVPDPGYDFVIEPSFRDVMDYLSMVEEQAFGRDALNRVSVDLETRDRHIACLGLGLDDRNAICIPFMCVERDEGYWAPDQELAIVLRLRELLPRLKVIGQNFIYDTQYTIRHWALWLPLFFDTMIAHAVCFPGTPKGLDYLSSLYCRYHRYWKEESKDWDPKLGERQLWEYNCKDCVTTWESGRELHKVLEAYGLEEQFSFELQMVERALRSMLRGVRMDLKRRDDMVGELMNAANEREVYLHNILDGMVLAKSKGAKPWYRSPIQQRKLFYEELGLPVIRHRKTGKPTVDDEALPTIGKREPLLLPLIERLRELRSINVISSTFVQMPLDHDNRARCSYNPVGTETFRFNSSEDAFGFGTNLQNIPRGDE